jgi:hypothetical protein
MSPISIEAFDRRAHRGRDLNQGGSVGALGDHLAMKGRFVPKAIRASPSA